MRAIYYATIVALLIVLSFFWSGCKRCHFCGDKKAEYDTVYIHQPDTCSYIILKKRTDKSKAIPLGKKNTLLEKFKPIDTAVARQYTQNYNSYYNPGFNNTAFIDFSTDELLAYLIEVTNWANHNSKNFDNLRIYFARNGGNENNVVLAATTAEEGDFIKHPDFKPVDYGSLCPPPRDCYLSRKAELLRRAIAASNGTIRPAP